MTDVADVAPPLLRGGRAGAGSVSVGITGVTVGVGGCVTVGVAFGFSGSLGVAVCGRGGRDGV